MAEKYPQVGDDKNLMSLTGELLFKPEGETGFINMGVLTMHQMGSSIERKNVTRSLRFGQKRVVREDTISMDMFFMAESNEHTVEMMELMLFGTKQTDDTQALNASGTATIADVIQRRSYYIGARQVTDVTVAVSATPKVLGTDYTLDALTGMIGIIDGGSISDGDDLTVTYKCPAVTSAKITALTRTQREGSFELIQTDPVSAAARAIWTFTGVISLESNDDYAGEQHKAKFRIHPTSQPVVLMPPVA